MEKRRIIAKNVNGLELHAGPWYSIVKPNGDGTNKVFNVGKKAYILSIWRTQHANAKKYIDPLPKPKVE